MSNKRQCASCGKLFSDRMRNCPFCGRTNIPPAINITAHCPRCKQPLEHHDYRGNDIDMCPHCSGIWLDLREFKYLTSKRDVYQDDSIPHEYIRPPLQHESGYIPCPVCGKLMTRRNFSKISGVMIDVCGDHGVWMDAGELEHIRSFIANGGLDEYQDKQIMVNREAISSLDSRLSDVEFMQKLLHHWKFKRWIFS